MTSCPHSIAGWVRTGSQVKRICGHCKAVLATDTVALNLPSNPALANQDDPDELDALASEF